ncbi:dethiobiotin synthase [Alkanindiges sp. WGS2144]|uniref:dethiobiotin synthase n=1 Tax=Alkanindiges sp. WGS2144 TaxID=3366808 RepID=UPI0037534DFD
MGTAMRQTYFVTGTDTNVGKTFVSSVLLARAKAQGHLCFGLKPISAGCVQDEEEKWRSGDADQLKQYASVALVEELIAPIKLPLATSPHIAAQAHGERLQAGRVAGHIRAGLSTRASHILVEGAGGWRVPINMQENISDVVKLLGLPVILVVGIRLGCLNHALLTAEAIVRDGLKLAGWVANCLQPDEPFMQEQLDTLIKKIPAPCLGVLHYQPGQPMDPLIEQVRWPAEL